VVGLYLDPPERAVVLCVDVKSQIQALDRGSPVRPLLPGTPQRATHDYKRFGTSNLYAALDHGSGKVIGSLHARHRAIELKKFLQRLDCSDRYLPPTAAATRPRVTGGFIALDPEARAAKRASPAPTTTRRIDQPSSAQS
jgi:hypothetical protein